MIKLKCIICGEDLILNYYDNKLYYYDCNGVCNNKPEHGYVMLEICNNQIVSYEVPFNTNKNFYYIESYNYNYNENKIAETILNRKYDEYFHHKEILRVPKFYPLSINDWISDFNKIKEQLLELSIFA